MRSLLIVAAAALALGGCKSQTISVEKPVITYVKVPVRCPSEEEYKRLKANQPDKLANQPAPATAGERVAKMASQLGKYEAPGGWVDQVDTTLDRCQAVQ